MHYIRFLKSPRLSAPAPTKSKKAPFSSADPSAASITALVTITSDLGESTLYRDCPLIAHLHQGTTHTSRKYLWKAGARSLLISLPATKFSPRLPVTLEVAADGSGADNLLLRGPECAVLSAWSPPIVLSEGVKTEDLVERRLEIGTEEKLRIWEEARESIARHIWDAGLALTGYIAQTVHGSGTGGLPALDEILRAEKGIKVLELGSGCGIVGLAIGKLRERCEVTMTDLGLAEEIAGRNINASPPLTSSTTRFAVVDWDEDIPGEVLKVEGCYDLFVVADCTYNVDSAPALVKTITSFARESPEALVVIAHKKRHETEGRFFEMMGEFEVVDRMSVLSGKGDELEEAGEVDLYTMRYRGMGH